MTSSLEAVLQNRLLSLNPPNELAACQTSEIMFIMTIFKNASKSRRILIWVLIDIATSFLAIPTSEIVI